MPPRSDDLVVILETLADHAGKFILHPLLRLFHHFLEDCHGLALAVHAVRRGSTLAHVTSGGDQLQGEACHWVDRLTRVQSKQQNGPGVV